jgi:suppressor of G2 allele of SKP1
MTSVTELLQAGNEAYVDEQYDSAFDLYTAALAAPDAATKENEVRLKRSQVQLKRGKAAEALADAEAVIKNHFFSDMAHLRAGIALFELGRLDESLKSFLRGVDMARDAAGSGQFNTWIAKVKRALHDQRAAAPADGVSAAELAEAKREAAAINAAAAAGEPLPASGGAVEKPRYRHDWYQNPSHVTVELFIKKLSKESATIEFRSDEVRIAVREPEPGAAPFELHLTLFAPIDPPQTSVQYMSTKLVIKMAKATPAQWPALEQAAGGTRKALPVVINPGAGSVTGDASGKKHLASFEKNWDRLANVLAPEEKPEGDEALNALFKTIYKDGSDEQRKAMIKSFTESGGTCLSTNWDEIGSKTVPVTPPDGVIAKKFDDLHK